MNKHVISTLLGVAMLATSSLTSSARVYEVYANAGTGADTALTSELTSKIGVSELKTTIFAIDEKVHTVRGILMRDLIKHLGATGTSAQIVALDGYLMDVPTDDFMKYDVILATEIDGKKLSVRDKGPAWVIYPASQHPELKDTLYETRSVWQVMSIKFH